MVTRYEVGDTFETEIAWTSGSSYVDPSGNMSFIKVYDPKGNLIIDESGAKVTTGIYEYYISTQTTDELGLYRIQWMGRFDYGSPWNYSPKYDSEVVEIVRVLQA